jgi:hypothetical protein
MVDAELVHGLDQGPTDVDTEVLRRPQVESVVGQTRAATNVEKTHSSFRFQKFFVLGRTTIAIVLLDGEIVCVADSVQSLVHHVVLNLDGSVPLTAQGSVRHAIVRATYRAMPKCVQRTLSLGIQ